MPGEVIFTGNSGLDKLNLYVPVIKKIAEKFRISELQPLAKNVAEEGAGQDSILLFYYSETAALSSDEAESINKLAKIYPLLAIVRNTSQFYNLRKYAPDFSHYLRRDELTPELLELAISDAKGDYSRNRFRDEPATVDIYSRIMSKYITHSENKFFPGILEIVTEELESKYGLFGYVEGEKLICPSLTPGVWSKCSLPDKELVFSVNDWGGIWGRALLSGESYYKNGNINVPDGHIGLNNALTVPIKYNSQIIGLIVVADRTGGYDDEDKRLLEWIAKLIAPVLYLKIERDKETFNRKRTEKFLNESEKRFKLLSEATFEGIIIYRDGKVCNINKSLQDMFLLQRNDALDRNLLKEIIRGDIWRLFEGKELKEIQPAEYTGIKKDGTSFPVELEARPFIHEDKRYYIVAVRDIGERKNTQIELRKSEKKLRLLTENSHDILLILSTKGKILFESGATERILGYKAGNRVGMSVSTFLHPDDISQNKNVFSSILDEKDGVRVTECRYRHENGTYKFLEIIGRNNVSEESIRGITINAWDVTERKLTEESVRETARQFRSIWEKSNDGMRLTNKDGVVLLVNDAFLEMFSLRRNEIEGRYFLEIYNESDIDSSIEHYRNRFESRNIGKYIESEVRLKDNSVRTLAISSSFIKFRGDEEVLLSIFRDISDEKKSEKLKNIIFGINNAVFESSDLNSLFNKIHQIFEGLVNTRNFFIAIYNKGDDTISIPYNLSGDEFPGRISVKKTFTGYVIKTNSTLMVDDRESAAMVDQGLVEMVGKPSKIWLGVPIRVRQEVIGVIVVQDYEDINAITTTDRELLEYTSDQIGLAIDRLMSREELKESEVNLKAANKAKDKFFSIISHDLRNPFNTLIGFTEILLEDYDDLQDTEKKFFIEEMRSTAKNSFDLLDNLLQWSRSQRGMIKIEPEKLDIKAITDNALNLMAGNALNKNINLLSRVGNVDVFADQDTIFTVIRNLVSNALKFTEEYGSVEITGQQSGEFYHVSVKDSGIGMSKEIVDKLFKIDESVSREGTKEEKGTGLGLILCREFVSQNGGEIEVESEEGKGSIFRFTVPLYKK